MQNRAAVEEGLRLSPLLPHCFDYHFDVYGKTHDILQLFSIDVTPRILVMCY